MIGRACSRTRQFVPSRTGGRDYICNHAYSSLRATSGCQCCCIILKLGEDFKRLSKGRDGLGRYEILPQIANYSDTCMRHVLIAIGLAAEGPARKRLQKSPSDNNRGADRRATLSASTAKDSAETRSNFTTRRRQSVLNQKAPLGPRPELSSSKRQVPCSLLTNGDAANICRTRAFSNNTSNPYDIPAVGAPAETPGDARERQASINSISRFSFASIAPGQKIVDEHEKPTASDTFLAPINFDDFHNSITGDGPSLNHFPLPGRGKTTSGSNLENSGLPQPSNNSRSIGRASGGPPLSRSGSLLSKQNNQTRQTSHNSSTSESMPSSAASSMVRTRRQSHYPPSASNNPHIRAPRKSIGPGTFVSPDTIDNAPPRRRPSLTSSSRKNSQDQSRPEATGLAVRLNNRGLDTSCTDGTKGLTTTRNLKTKSLQPPSREPSDSNLLTPTRTPVHSRSSSTNPGRTTGKTGSATPNTPSSNKRMSVMPPHATGLGARTISPTDARRMKRMSMMPNPPPLPNTPPTPQPEPAQSHPRSAAQSPSLIPRKSLTPSSSRTTPDPNRKSYSSGQSLSSSTSYNSVRTSGISMQPRLPTNVSSSRLPTPKPRLDTAALDDDEEVPPVPAIPKAYESPQSEIDQPFFSARSSSLPPGAQSVNSSPVVETYSPPMPANEMPNENSEFKRKSSLVPPDTELRHKPAQNIGKKNLQPLRLPPLNLLPLSTPTAARIKSFGDTRNDQSDGSHTPPLRQQNVKTPSTPMTASKSSFFSRSHQDTESVQPAPTRSSSSHFAARSDSTTFRAPSSSSTNMPFAFESQTAIRTISPYVSSSLPKTSGEFFPRSKASGEFLRNVGKLTGPRAQVTSPKAKEASLSPTESDSVFSTASLRRKLSLTRKKSTSKSRLRPADKAQPDPAKYDNMPPPRLPASATWSNLSAPSTSPTSRPSYLTSRRKTSTSSITNGVQKRRSQSFSSDQSPKVEGRPSTDTMHSTQSFDIHPNRTSSIMTPVQKIFSSRTPPIQQRPQDSGLDRDDLIAEEEMKKLASRRKDFESAARELDELRRGASAKDRVSPVQALKMVNLNIFERGEIIDFKDIYFCGTHTAKKHVGDLNAQSANFGYDDERGDYNIVPGDHLAYRYEVVDLLGKGSFGQVVRCVDHKTGILVAVKIIRNKKRFHQQALVEVNILQKLREWVRHTCYMSRTGSLTLVQDPNNKHSVVNFDQSFYFRGHLCISTDLLGMNLYEFIKAHDFRGFSLKLIRRFTKQLLGSLVLLSGHKVIHCDLKPENVLLAHPIHSEIKVIDFGSSCFENEKVYTYIQSRFYRSPEVILGMSYGMPIDMWSLGCILAELLTGYPIFPGENEQEQLACIMEIFGPPEKHLIEKSSRKKLFFDSLGKPRLTVSSKGRRRRPSSKELRQVLKCDDEAFLDFITRCLRWDPARRLSPHEAMNHEFITGMKLNPRQRAQGPAAAAAAASSPMKRTNSITTPASARPLPEPPATSFRNGSAVRNRDMPNSSPLKPPAPKRHSTFNGTQATIGMKRASNGAALAAASALPRVAAGQRNTSGQPNLATAAAAASLVR